jgi:hypothetical protein
MNCFDRVMLHPLQWYVIMSNPNFDQETKLYTRFFINTPSPFCFQRPLWPSGVDQEMLFAKSQIENSPLIKNETRLYAPIYRNVSMFRRYTFRRYIICWQNFHPSISVIVFTRNEHHTFWIPCHASVEKHKLGHWGRWIIMNIVYNDLEILSR